MRYVSSIVLVIGCVSMSACTAPADSVAETQTEPSEQRPGNSDDSTIHGKDADTDTAHSHHTAHGDRAAHGGGAPAGDDGPSAASHANHSQEVEARHSSRQTASPSGTEFSIAIGDKVPDFEVMIDGKKLNLSELRHDDGVIALTFWCSFCHSCRHVEKYLDQLAGKFKGRATVIALDASAGETREQVGEVAKKNGLSLPIALDSSGKSADIFGTRVTTTTVIIDQQCVLRYRGQFGDSQHPFAEDALNAILAGSELKVSETRQKGCPIERE